MSVPVYPLPVYRGRKINRFLCLLFLTAAAVCLAAAGILALSGKQAGCHTALILALIMGGFALLYGILWLVWGRKEKKRELALREAAARTAPPADPARVSYREFNLPKERLTEAARRRFHSVLRWAGIAGLGMFLLVEGILLIRGAVSDPLQPLGMLVFCLALAVPGVIVQWALYKTYARSVPSRISLSPGKLVVDGAVFSVGEIREIRISPERVRNPDSPSVFREMLIRTDGRGKRCHMDLRSGSRSNEAPFWEEYGAFAAALSEWGAANGVPVNIAYMD